MSLDISHRVPWDRSGPTFPCVWCGKPTDIRAITPFRPDLGSLPLHLFCGVFMRDAYRAFKEGRATEFDLEEVMRFATNLHQLEAGS